MKILKTTLIVSAIFLNISFANADEQKPATQTPSPTPVILSQAVCSDVNGQSISMIELQGTSYYNGTLQIRGNDIVDYFYKLGYLHESDITCQLHDGATATDAKIKDCTMAARISAKNLTVSHNGRFSENFVVRPDSGGAKLLVYFGSNEPQIFDWWFSTCEQKI